MFVKELDNSLEVMEKKNLYVYEMELEQKKEIIDFLDALMDYIRDDSKNGLDYLVNYLKINKGMFKFFESVKLYKDKIVKELIKEYKVEYRKNYFNNKYLGLNGVFDNKLFCSIIRNKIDKYVYCNKVTKAKYKHLVAFLNEFLNEMENAKDPLKTLKHKMKIYHRYRKNEYVEIRKDQKSKIDIVKEILEEYKKEKKIYLGCK